MKAAPTLADAMCREWSRSRYRQVDRDNWLAGKITQARKFVLDEGMSAFMADLGYMSLNACKTNQQQQQLVEGMRRMARLPHALTWIEFDKQAHRRRVKEVYHPEIAAEPDSVPDRSGWLLVQHPKIDTAFMAIHCTSHSWYSHERVAMPSCGEFAYAWTVDDAVPPWPRDPFYHHDRLGRIDRTDRERMISPAGILTGVLDYRSETVSVIPSPHFSAEAAAAFATYKGRDFDPLGELAHDLRYLWSLLATINELPTSQVTMQPTTGYIARGAYRKFAKHTVLSLTIPVKRYQTVAKRALVAARRQGHKVRGHFRKDRWHPGERIWVREHLRGDLSRGFTEHDYAVHHDV